MPSYAVFGLGPLELLIIVAIIVILFLPALLPKLAKRVGETVTTLKDMANKGLDEDSKEAPVSKESGEASKDNGDAP